MKPEDPLSLELAKTIGLKIRDFRRERHITQVELARRLGMKPGPLNVIEKGRHVPSGRVLYRLAQELGVTVDDLFGRCRVMGGAGEIPFLPFMDTPGDAAVVKLAGEVARDFMGLEDISGAMKCAAIPLYIPFSATEGGIEQLVNQVRHQLGITHAVVFDYMELLENAGLRVVFHDFPETVKGEPVLSLCAYDRVHANAFFFVRRSMNPERQLFRLLFELGRIYWHTRQTIVGVKPIRDDQLLDEVHAARKFAAFFLMPSLSVRATVSQLGITPDGWTYDLLLRIKHRFGVSAQTFCIRLEELGLIEPKLAETLKAQIKAHYAATDYAEPGGSMRQISYNGRLGDLLLNAQSKEGDPGDEAREIAGRLKGMGVGV